MKVKVINWTMDALETLIYTKNTRLAGEQTIDEIGMWPEERKLQELAYMRDTIKSSWEFVDYTFEISGVSRAFTHQLVRTRQGSYAQESQRTVDVRDHEVKEPEFSEETLRSMWRDAVEMALTSYGNLVDHGAPIQDARGILPTNVTTSIIAKFSLRTLHEMAMTRLCTRTQGEYQDVFRAMKAAVVQIHPWAEPFIRVACATNGICIFPRYKECPIQRWTYNASPCHGTKLRVIQEQWEQNRHEAHPVAKDGRTM